MRRPTSADLVFATLLAASLPAQSSAGAWPQFRGPGSQGVAPGSAALPTEFGPKKNHRWTTAIPAGVSSPCVVGDRIFLTGAKERELYTICLSRETGAVLWRQELVVPKLERMHRINSPAAPTPCADAARVYVYFGSFGLLCYDHDGEEVWRRPVPPRRNIFGTAASLVVAKGRLVFNRDTNEGSQLAVLEPKTGEAIWEKDRSGFVSGWSTPVVWRNGAVDELLVYGAFRLMAYDLKDGAERWSVPGLADEPCITPATGEGLVFVSSYNMRTNPEVIGLPTFDALLEQYDASEDGQLTREEVKANKSILSRSDADGEGDHPLRGFFRFLDRDRDGQLNREEWQRMHAWLGSFKHRNALVAIRPGDGDKAGAEIVWQHPRGVPETPSPLYYKGRVYLVKNGGVATCLDARTGEVRFQGRIGARGPCYASPVVGDGKIYTASARGVVTVLAVADELRVLARNDLGERIMATPALVDGVVYVRTDQHLHAFAERDG